MIYNQGTISVPIYEKEKLSLALKSFFDKKGVFSDTETKCIFSFQQIQGDIENNLDDVILALDFLGIDNINDIEIEGTFSGDKNGTFYSKEGLVFFINDTVNTLLQNIPTEELISELNRRNMETLYKEK